jgi:hypothetical protein
MSTTNGSDPIDQLRAIDPVRADGVPDASLARVSAMIQEHIMSDVRRDPVRPPRGPMLKLGGLALAGAFALAIALGNGFGIQTPAGGDGNGATPDPAGGFASCLAYDPASLPTFDIVFDGTVTAVDGDQVTFDVNEDWKGAGETITLTAPEADMALTGPIPDFEVGGRYLVSAAGTTVNACGYSLDYAADDAAAWAAVFD